MDRQEFGQTREMRAEADQCARLSVPQERHLSLMDLSKWDVPTLFAAQGSRCLKRGTCR